MSDEMKEVTRTLVIRSSEWARGYVSSLNDGKKFCCLGLDARDRGIPKELFLNVDHPRGLNDICVYDSITSPELRQYFKDWETKPIDENGQSSVLPSADLADLAVLVNDYPMLTDDMRILNLLPIFAKLGIQIDWRPNE